MLFVPTLCQPLLSQGLSESGCDLSQKKRKHVTATGSLFTQAYVSILDKLNPESHASFGNFESFSKDDQVRVLNSEIEDILAAELALFPNAIVPLDDLVYLESQIDRFTQYFTNIGKS